jgi:glutamine amidotransferase
MCRHITYLGPPRALSTFLFDAPHSLAHQARTPTHQRPGAMNADGWGVGWWDQAVRPEPARYRSPAPMWSDTSFRSVAELTFSGAIVAAARNASPGSALVVTGNAPFTAERWLFSLNGYVDRFWDGVGEELRRTVSPARLAPIAGTADTEVLFALVLDRLDAGASPLQALDDVTATVLARTDGKLNLLLCDGHEVTATASGNSLFTLRGHGLATGGVLVASEPLDDDPAWTQVPQGRAVLATSDRLDTAALSALTPTGGPS